MKLQDYLHYYMGAAYWTNNSQGEINKVTLQYVIDMIEKGKNVQLHLRRLSDMKEQEIISLLQSMVPADMEDKPSDDEYGIEMFRNDGGNLVDANVLIGAEYTCRCYIGQISIKKCGTVCAYDETGDEHELVNGPKAYHYLLTQRFDLFGLIDAGLAVDVKTI